LGQVGAWEACGHHFSVLGEAPDVSHVAFDGHTWEAGSQDGLRIGVHVAEQHGLVSGLSHAYLETANAREEARNPHRRKVTRVLFSEGVLVVKEADAPRWDDKAAG
jgi:hypothetical protein